MHCVEIFTDNQGIIMEIIDKYEKELIEDTKLNVLNLCDVQMKLPSIKHKWASRLINHKIDVDKTKSLICKAKERLIEEQLADSAVKSSRPALEKKVENHEVIIRLRNTIKEHEYAIMYLDKVEQIFKSMTYDIKNLTEIMKLEQL